MPNQPAMPFVDFNLLTCYAKATIHFAASLTAAAVHASTAPVLSTGSDRYPAVYEYPVAVAYESSCLIVKHAIPVEEVVSARVNNCTPPVTPPVLAVCRDPPAVAVSILSVENVVPLLYIYIVNFAALPLNCQRASAILAYKPANTSNASAVVGRKARPVATLIMLYVA